MAVTQRHALWNPHEDNIAKAFDRLWAQLWAMLADQALRPATADASRRPTTMPQPKPAPHRNTKLPTVLKRRKKVKRVPRLQGRHPASSRQIPAPQLTRERSPTSCIQPQIPVQQGRWRAWRRAWRSAPWAGHSRLSPHQKRRTSLLGARGIPP
ncbi:Hypothetical predicted protein [Pelobates cultripes]|uniref:Uncharacterized protein n=1 Tax=Pelobates cultripes TaxID=61616 RepID=A0AAD1SLA8_PELCU|nr:Hypothetical predicted protein [Pelobates cultripes]